MGRHMAEILFADTLRPTAVLIHDALNQLPAAAGVALLVAPVLVSAASKQWIAVWASAAFCLGAVALASSTDPMMATSGLLSGFLASCAAAAWGLQQQRQSIDLDNIHALLAQMHRESRAFLHALDRRSMIADRTMLDASEVAPSAASETSPHNGHGGEAPH